MLHKIKDLNNYTVTAIDEAIGKPHEFCFDDRAWTIRYLVVNIGDWLLEHKIVLATSVLGQPDCAAQQLPVSLTRQQLENSPDIETHRPVYLQKKTDFASYLAWGGAEWHTPGAFMISPAAVELLTQELPAERASDDPHLRSTREVIGYHLAATDGEIGHIDDFIVNDQTWHIDHIVVDTRNWLPGRKVLIPPRWILAVEWADKQVALNLERAVIENSPEFNEESLKQEI